MVLLNPGEQAEPGLSVEYNNIWESVYQILYILDFVVKLFKIYPACAARTHVQTHTEEQRSQLSTDIML